MCPARVFNLLNPISFISYGFFLYSIVNIYTGMTYAPDNNDCWYESVYYSENPVRFVLTV
jgi:hypothetical protein